MSVAERPVTTAKPEWTPDNPVPDDVTIFDKKWWKPLQDALKYNPPNGNNYFDGAHIYFPDDLTKYEFYITFDFAQYERPSVLRPLSFETVGRVRLPIPNNLVDDQRLIYAEEEQGPIVGAALNGAKQSWTEGLLGGAVGAVARGVDGPLARGGLQIAGLAVNPFLTVMFKAPMFKRHSFQWRLSPNNQKESAKIKKLIDRFRYHSLPDLYGLSQGVLLTYPDIVRVTLQPDDRYTYKFKPCVLETVSVNYAPGITPAFYQETKAPAEVDLRITLLEIEYWLKRDFENNGNRYNPDVRTVVPPADDIQVSR